MNKEVLVNVGLTNREAEAYLALLAAQESLVSEISRKTMENRTHLYDTLNSLISKGLVSYVIKNGKKYFRPASPSKLIDYVKEKEKLLSEQMPKLNELYKPKGKTPSVEVYEGQEGIKTVLNDVLKVNKEWLCLGSTGKSPEILPFFLGHFHKQRQKQKLHLRVIYNDDKLGTERGKEVKNQMYSEVKYMPKTSPATTYIYGDTIVIIHWEKDKLIAVMMRDDTIAESYRSYFNFWKFAKK